MSTRSSEISPPSAPQSGKETNAPFEVAGAFSMICLGLLVRARRRSDLVAAVVVAENVLCYAVSTWCPLSQRSSLPFSDQTLDKNRVRSNLSRSDNGAPPGRVQEDVQAWASEMDDSDANMAHRETGRRKKQQGLDQAGVDTADVTGRRNSASRQAQSPNESRAAPPGRPSRSRGMATPGVSHSIVTRPAPQRR